MGYSAHRKQAEAHQAFMSGDYKRGVLMWGRQCFVGNTLIATPDGYTHIKDLQIGDRVLSYGDNPEYKKITNKWEYRVDTDPKPMLQFTVDNETITATYDHKFYWDGHYVPLYQLAWGAMATSDREQLKLLCEQYGQTFDYEEARQRGLDISDEASGRWFWLSENGGGRQNNQDAPFSGSKLDTESQELTNSKSHQSRQNGQPSGELGVADGSGQHTAQPQGRTSSQQTGRELRNAHIERETGTRDTGTQGNNDLPEDSRQVWSISLHDSGHNLPQILVSSVTTHTSVKTYAIEVEDNANYCITTKNVLVGNSGKTFFSTQHAWISAVLKQGRYFIVFQTYKQAHEVVWRQYVPLIPKELIHKKNEQDLLIELNYIENTPIKLPNGETIMVNHDKTKPRSTIQLLGSDQADTHRGFKGDGMIFDEYATQNPDHWDAVYKHFFTTTNGWAIFMGTPRGYNHFYDLVEYAKEDDRWFYQQATWRDSPYVKKEFIEEEKAEATKKGTLSTFLQEVELEFRAVQGAVYPSFNRDVHIVKPHDIPDDLTYYGAIDFGWHTTAFLLLGVDKDQNWYVIDEVYGREETLTDVMPRIRDKLADKRISLIIGDSANRDAIEIMGKEYPMMGVNKANDTKGYQVGIGLVTEKLKPRIQLTGPPKPTLYFSSVCKNLIREIEAYRFPEDKPERNPSDVPVKEDDHGPDALRYLFLQLKFGLVKDEKPLKFEIEKQTNMYGIL